MYSNYYNGQFYAPYFSQVPFPRQVRRKLTIQGNIHIKDYEVVGSDEHCDRRIDRTFRLTPGAYSLLFTEVLGCGGECRTEVDIWARVLDNGQIQVSVYSRFYEGSSEGTNELEDQKQSVNHLIPRSVLTNITHQLVNVDFPGDDTSTVSLNFLNSPIED